MNIYLTIITTVLVLTQVVRVTQNHIQLARQRKQLDDTLDWIRDNDISERDFEIQRKVFQMLYCELKRMNDVRVMCAKESADK